jgi:hypothetical protein
MNDAREMRISHKPYFPAKRRELFDAGVHILFPVMPTGWISAGK